MAPHTPSLVRALMDTKDAFHALEGSNNTDYADFAGMALSEFKSALRNPTLTRSQLVNMLRKGMVNSKHDDLGEWSVLMAYQLKSSTNEDFI